MSFIPRTDRLQTIHHWWSRSFGADIYPDMYELYDLYDLYDLAHVAGWEQ